MSDFSTRLRHIVTRTDWAILLSSTYAAAHRLEDDEAIELLRPALGNTELLDELDAQLENVLRARVGPRSSEDQVLDRLSASLAKRRARVRAASTADISAALGRIDLETGRASPALRDALASDKGRKLLAQGFRALCEHVAKELLK